MVCGMRRLAGAVLMVLMLAGVASCSGGDSGSSSASSSPSPRSSSSSHSTAPKGSTDLRAAVQGYSDAFLGGKPKVAYGYLSAKCHRQESLRALAAIIAAAKATYGKPLPITSYKAQVAGGLARVTYGYSVPVLNQDGEPWVRERGGWKNDEC